MSEKKFPSLLILGNIWSVFWILAILKEVKSLTGYYYYYYYYYYYCAAWRCIVAFTQVLQCIR
jgi:hypothetical protein